MHRVIRFAIIFLSAAMPSAAFAAQVQPPADIPRNWSPPETSFDYVRRSIEIPMRDGVTLHTVIVLPKGAKNAPILLKRTPYNAEGRASRSYGRHMIEVIPQGDEVFAQAGYICVYQDMRGKYQSQGEFIVTRPPIGPLNPSMTDDSTDAWDTIDWLVKHLPESNGKVGMIGSSYEGWAVVMALLQPHPALKVAAPESPMIDGWMGDDWFHYGAFRQVNLDFFSQHLSRAGKGPPVPRDGYDDYSNFLAAGSAGRWAVDNGFDQIGFWTRLAAHPAYDGFWQGEALIDAVVAHPSQIPTMWIQGLWDEEDMYGAVHVWEALKAHDLDRSNFLVMGPWGHSQVNFDGSTRGPLHWRGDTAGDFRREMLLPFFDAYLKAGAPAVTPPPAMVYNTSEDHWDRFDTWPAQPVLTPLYLQEGFTLGWSMGKAGSDSYVSDPAKPVPFVPRPMSFNDTGMWQTWLVQDQRFASDRPDVLSSASPVLTRPVRVSGTPIADIFAKITGSDTDWIVKIIDVYPGAMPDNPAMSGYELPISLDIFRGRYRASFTHPSSLQAGKVLEYKFQLPSVNHVFGVGHKIMIQIQSSLFPVYDRNPQRYVTNILFAQPDDFQKSTISVLRGRGQNSAILLPVVTK